MPLMWSILTQDNLSIVRRPRSSRCSAEMVARRPPSSSPPKDERGGKARLAFTTRYATKPWGHENPSCFRRRV